MIDYNKIKELLYKRGGLSRAIIMAMHTTKHYKLKNDELIYLRDSRDLLRDEVLRCYSYMDEHDQLEIYLDYRDCVI
ncbi:hypothetical protein [Butyrivibrio sp. AE3004]|uniref:hypothetical protein n=1 Tax=Butyrivibrio sp. AE3004 TaxID=1506994 RepID=UPI000494735C|nr:hypothetical protein [Butyrivibrio sp. AE3004]